MSYILIPGVAFLFQGVDHVVIFVNDLERAKRFYRDVLGLPLVVDLPRFAGVAAGGQMLGLHPSEANAADVGRGAIPYLLVSNIESSVSHLRERGVEFHLGPVTMPSGERIAAFRDSEGNAVGICQKLERPA